jgi:hypothetical protein
MLVTSEASLTAMLRDHYKVTGDATSVMLAYASECIRSALATVDEPQSVQALTSRVRETVEPAFSTLLLAERWKDDSLGRSWAVRALKTLETLGDVYKRADGRYQPTPARLIHTRLLSDHFLISGTAPFAAMCNTYGATLLSYGHARFVRANDLPSQLLNDLSKWQDLTSWIGAATEPPQTWINAFLDDFRKDGYDGPPLGCTKIEVFFPENKTRRWQSLDSLKEAPSGIRLCRGFLDGAPYFRRHFLAILSGPDSIVETRRSLLLEPNDGLRMVIAIGTMLKSETRVTIIEDAQGFSLRGLPKLPWPERRALAIAISYDDQAGKPVLYFPLAAKAYLVAMCRSIGIRLFQSTAASEPAA